VTAPVIGVLALQGDVREHVRVLGDCGADARPVRTPRELDAVQALVIPGGESTTIAKLAEIFELADPLRERIAQGMPAYGSCAGMILLAHDLLDARADQTTFGGLDVTVRRNAFGRQIDSFESEVSVEGVEGGPFHAVFIRAPRVERVGPAVTVIATVEDGPAVGSIVGVRQGDVIATSFHPELTGDTRIHSLFVDIVKGHR
jgi:5'-phosphate synthase pdxT subunit